MLNDLMQLCILTKKRISFISLASFTIFCARSNHLKNTGRNNPLPIRRVRIQPPSSTFRLKAHFWPKCSLSQFCWKCGNFRPPEAITAAETQMKNGRFERTQSLGSTVANSRQANNKGVFPATESE